MRSESLLSKIFRRSIYSSILYRISKLDGFLVVFCYVGAVAADDSSCLASVSFCRSAVSTVIYVCPQRLRSWPAKLTLTHTHTPTSCRLAYDSLKWMCLYSADGTRKKKQNDWNERKKGQLF